MKSATRAGVAYSSLINASLAMMSGDIPELMMRSGSVSRNGHGLRGKVRKRSLAVLDRNGTSGHIIGSLVGDNLWRRAGDKTGGCGGVVVVNKVVNVHGLRGGNVLLRVLAQLGNAAGGVLGGITESVRKTRKSDMLVSGRRSCTYLSRCRLSVWGGMRPVR